MSKGEGFYVLPHTLDRLFTSFGVNCIAFLVLASIQSHYYTYFYLNVAIERWIR